MFAYEVSYDGGASWTRVRAFAPYRAAVRKLTGQLLQGKVEVLVRRKGKEYRYACSLVDEPEPLFGTRVREAVRTLLR